MPTVLSLFDRTTLAVRPWAEAGYECHCLDVLHPGFSREDVDGGGSIVTRRWDAERESSARLLARYEHEDVRMILAFPPCTDLATSGARHFARKLEIDPGIQQRAASWARIAERLGTWLGCPWVAENPRSVLATLWRRADHEFDPYEYGGYLPEDDVHPLWPGLIPPRDAYTKRTWLWTGGGFRMPARRAVPLRRENPMFSRLSGQDPRTAAIRSATPRGWARAVLLANGG